MDGVDVRTGIDDLDHDLSKLFQVCEGASLKQIKDAISDRDLSGSQLMEQVPASILRLAYIFGDPLRLKVLAEKVPAGALVHLNRAAALIEEHFPSLVEHPGYTEFMAAEFRGKKDGGSAALDPESRKRIASVSTVSSWFGNPPDLQPSVRLMLSNRSDDILLDSPLDWNDLVFLSMSLLQVLSTQMDSAKDFSRFMLDLPAGACSSIAERIAIMEECLKQIKEIAPAFGIDVDSAKEGDEKREAGV